MKQASLFASLRSRAALFAMSAAILGASPLAAQAGPAHHQNACKNCGTVVAVRTYEAKAERGTGLGVATGAVVGGLLGNQVGGGNGRTLATVAGAVGGAYAGNQIERNVRSRTMTEVRVRMRDGSVRKFTEEGRSSHYDGEAVRVVQGRVVAQR